MQERINRATMTNSIRAVQPFDFMTQNHLQVTASGLFEVMTSINGISYNILASNDNRTQGAEDSYHD